MDSTTPLLPADLTCASPRARRVLLIGWDAADWKMIDPLLARGQMPNLKRLIDQGMRADLTSLDPKLSPLLWTSIATGKTADRHGILNFLEPDITGRDPTISTSTSRRTKALWNILSQAGLRSVVINWYASHPAEPINGACVSNVYQEARPERPDAPWPMTDGAVHPAPLAQAIADCRIHPGRVPATELMRLLPRLRDVEPSDPRLRILRTLLAQNAGVHRAALKLLREQTPWDCAMVFFDTIDVAGHHFMAYHPPRMAHIATRDFGCFREVMNGVYRLQDAQLGELMAAAGPETTVVLVSDHGFHCDHLRPQATTPVDDAHAAMDATWHRQLGVLMMSGPGVRPGARTAGAGVLDIAPTVLTLLGLPIGADMDGRVLIEALSDGAEVRRIPSWDEVAGDAGLHPKDMRRDPFEAGEALRQMIELGYISPVEGGAESNIAMVDRETRYNLGVVFMTTQRAHLAVPIFRTLHEERPDDHRFTLNLAHSLHSSGDPVGAAAVLDDLLARNPGLTDASMLRAAALMASGRARDACTVLEEAVRRTPDRPELLRMLGEILTATGQWAAAENRLADAVRIDPQDPQTALALANLDLAAGRFESAAGRALDALELRPRFPEAQFALGVALAWLDELGDASRAFEHALSMQPGLVDALRFLEAIHSESGDPGAARRYGQAAAALEERDRDNIAARRDSARVGGPAHPETWAGRRGGKPPMKRAS